MLSLPAQAQNHFVSIFVNFMLLLCNGGVCCYMINLDRDVDVDVRTHTQIFAVWRAMVHIVAVYIMIHHVLEHSNRSLTLIGPPDLGP